MSPAVAVGLAACVIVVFALLAVLQDESTISSEQVAELPIVNDGHTPVSIQAVYSNYNWAEIDEGSPNKKLIVGT